MASFDYKDLYHKYVGHPSYNSKRVIEDELVRVIVAKYEMIIFTNKGEVLGDPEFGCDLPVLLHQTKVSATTVEADISNQISKYIPELRNIDYYLKVTFAQDPYNYQDMMFIDFKVREEEVNFFIS